MRSLLAMFVIAIMATGAFAMDASILGITENGVSINGLPGQLEKAKQFDGNVTVTLDGKSASIENARDQGAIASMVVKGL